VNLQTTAPETSRQGPVPRARGLEDMGAVSLGRGGVGPREGTKLGEKHPAASGASRAGVSALTVYYWGEELSIGARGI